MSHKKYKILVLGANGMLGSTLLNFLSLNHIVEATARQELQQPSVHAGFGVSAQDADLKKFENLIKSFQPDFVINCIGVVKQREESKSHAHSILINSLWPHLLLQMCQKLGTKLIHFSTDCIFSGQSGNYLESSPSDAQDLYGVSKFMGELNDAIALTLRTSIVGHEVQSNYSLIDWFLSQQGSCYGFTKAMYSGLTTVEVAHFLDRFALDAFADKKISGVYHLSSSAISKYDLLKIVAQVYQKNIEIKENKDFAIDRTLDSSKLQKILHYTPPSWQQQIEELHNYYKKINKLSERDV